MVVYVCPRCHYTTDDKSCINRHYNRKRICDIYYEDVSLEDCIDKLKEKRKPMCEHCRKIYSRNDSLKRHMKICKEKQIAKLIVEKEEEIKELRNRLEQQQHPTTTTNTSIGNHNKFNSDNITNNNTINININDFKNTNYTIALEDLKESIKQSLLKNDGRNMNIECENLIELVHCNDKYPENQNILLTDISRGDAKIKQGDRFIKVPKSEAIDQTAQNIVNLLKDNQLFNRYVKFHENKDEDTLREDNKAIERVLYNNKEKVKETAKKSGVRLK
jgi:hypothetical protein